MRIIFSLVQIVAGVLVFVFLVLPMNKNVQALRAKKTELLVTEKDARVFAELGNDVVERYQAIDPAQVTRLKKMIPDSVDNVRFVNDIKSVAEKNNLTLKKVDYNPEEIKKPTEAGKEVVVASQIGYSNADYGSYTLRFSVSGTYREFLNFIQDLEDSLRILDITDVSFQGENDEGGYDFSITAKSYWLKN